MDSRNTACHGICGKSRILYDVPVKSRPPCTGVSGRSFLLGGLSDRRSVCGGDFSPSFIASAFAATYAEVLARKLKAPATLFLIPAVVPLVPGSGLYYTISYAVQGDLEVSAGYGTQTLQFVLGIACGMCIIWALFTTVRPRKN